MQKSKTHETCGVVLALCNAFSFVLRKHLSYKALYYEVYVTIFTQHLSIQQQMARLILFGIKQFYTKTSQCIFIE